MVVPKIAMRLPGYCLVSRVPEMVARVLNH